jgi:hypothetical protein
MMKIIEGMRKSIKPTAICSGRIRCINQILKALKEGVRNRKKAAMT